MDKNNNDKFGVKLIDSEIEKNGTENYNKI
jgi:hypothetical protein